MKCLFEKCIKGILQVEKRVGRVSEFQKSRHVLQTFSNLKGIIAVRGEKAFVFSPEATRGHTEQNITNACLFKAIKKHDYL